VIGKSIKPSRGVSCAGSGDRRIKRLLPSRRAFNASRMTVGCEQLPPIQPKISPSAVITALSPGLPDVGFSARTTTAVANGRLCSRSSWTLLKNA